MSFMGSNQAIFLGHRVIVGGSRLSQTAAGIVELDVAAKAVRRKEQLFFIGDRLATQELWLLEVVCGDGRRDRM